MTKPTLYFASQWAGGDVAEASCNTLTGGSARFTLDTPPTLTGVVFGSNCLKYSLSTQSNAAMVMIVPSPGITRASVAPTIQPTVNATGAAPVACYYVQDSAGLFYQLKWDTDLVLKVYDLYENLLATSGWTMDKDEVYHGFTNPPWTFSLVWDATANTASYRALKWDDTALTPGFVIEGSDMVLSGVDLHPLTNAAVGGLVSAGTTGEWKMLQFNVCEGGDDWPRVCPNMWTTIPSGVSGSDPAHWARSAGSASKETYIDDVPFDDTDYLKDTFFLVATDQIRFTTSTAGSPVPGSTDLNGAVALLRLYQPSGGTLDTVSASLNNASGTELFSAQVNSISSSGYQYGRTVVMAADPDTSNPLTDSDIANLIFGVKCAHATGAHEIRCSEALLVIVWGDHETTAAATAFIPQIVMVI